jgi:hypothetical protein
VEFLNGWWTFTFSLFPGQEEVETFQSGVPFIKTSPGGQEYLCQVDLKGNVFHYICRYSSTSHMILYLRSRTLQTCDCGVHESGYLEFRGSRNSILLPRTFGKKLHGILEGIHFSTQKVP